MSEMKRVYTVDLDELEKAFVQYDEASDTLYINLSDEEPDETVLLENDIVVRIRNGRIIGLTILNLSRRFRSE